MYIFRILHNAVYCTEFLYFTVIYLKHIKYNMKFSIFEIIWSRDEGNSYVQYDITDKWSEVVKLNQSDLHIKGRKIHFTQYVSIPWCITGIVKFRGFMVRLMLWSKSMWGDFPFRFVSYIIMKLLIFHFHCYSESIQSLAQTDFVLCILVLFRRVILITHVHVQVLFGKKKEKKNKEKIKNNKEINILITL